MSANQCHYVPQLLLRQWSSDGREAWIWDPSTKTFEPRCLQQLCAMPGDAEINAFWNAKLENPAGDAMARLRSRTVEGPVDDLRGFQATTLDPLYQFFFCLRSRNPDTPRAWNGLNEQEHVALLRDRAQAASTLSDLRRRWKPALIEVPPEQAMALTDYTVFPLPPITRRAVLCLPISPTRALLMRDRRIENPQPVADMLASLHLGEVTHGGFGSVVILPPSARDWADANVQAELGGLDGPFHRRRLQWNPQIWAWSSETDLPA